MGLGRCQTVREKNKIVDSGAEVRQMRSSGLNPPAILSIAFRPFFLSAALFTSVSLLLWVAWLLGWASPNPALPMPLWHGHEMLFGVTMAVVIGFVLTAAQNWTGRTTTTPGLLALLVSLWWAARAGFLFPAVVPLWLTTTLDLILLPIVAILMARVLIATRNRRNYALLLILCAFAVLNGLTHLAFHGLIPIHLMHRAMDTTLLLIAVLLVFMGGRVIPFFTARRLPTVDPRRWPALDWTATILAALCCVAVLVAGRHPDLALLFFLAATVNLARLLAWRPWRVLQEPMLWVLHLGYAWIPVGFLLLGLHLVGAPLGWSAGAHVIAAGALGTLAIGMMSRVALGHTGRPLQAPPLMHAGFVVLSIAVILRLVAALAPNLPLVLALSGLLWAGAFLLYALVFTPIFLRPAVDSGAVK